jgi:hypothetical protein
MHDHFNYTPTVLRMNLVNMRIEIKTETDLVPCHAMPCRTVLYILDPITRYSTVHNNMSPSIL